ncbi:MAG TPA: type II secretion system major pseudopilin GspG [Candidatus Binatia bacterium]|nr:type II secretion system major pseudopilin GspG [Candidatus Binatia bacterium]
MLEQAARPRRRALSGAEGFTLIELLVVLVIIGLLATLVAPNFIGQSEKAKPKAARAQLENLRNALDMFQLDVGRYPSTDEGLQALRQRPGSAPRWAGPYVRDEIPLDPWGRPYVYRSPGEGGTNYDLGTYGADGRAGGEGNNADVALSG